MALDVMISGVNVNATSQLNTMHGAFLAQTILNTVRQLQDRSVTFSAGENDVLAEAFIDANGRVNSVDTGLTTAIFDANDLAYYAIITDEASGDSTSDPDSFTSPGNAFDGDTGTSATKTVNSVGATVTLGKTFSSKYVGTAFVKADLTSGAGTTNNIKVQTFDGATWTDHITLDGPGVGAQTFEGFVEINDTVEGVRVLYNANASTWSVSLSSLEYSNTVTDADIVINIPTGSFAATISEAVLGSLFNTWATDTTVQYKLTNGSEDSGFISVGNNPSLNEFTAFTLEPTKLTIRLGSSSSATITPSLKGVGVKADVSVV